MQGFEQDKGALAYAASERESEDVKSNRAELQWIITLT